MCSNAAFEVSLFAIYSISVRIIFRATLFSRLTAIQDSSFFYYVSPKGLNLSVDIVCVNLPRSRFFATKYMQELARLY